MSGWIDMTAERLANQHHGRSNAWETMSELGRRHFRDLARVAIEPLKKPSDAILEAASAALYEPSFSGGRCKDVCREIIVAAIREAMG